MNVTGWVWLQHSIEDRLLILAIAAGNNAERWAKKKTALAAAKFDPIFSIPKFGVNRNA